MTAATNDQYSPKPEHHFTFGLWTVGNIGRDPFGEAVRAPIAPPTIVRELGALGASGVDLHDEDLVPRDATLAERTAIVQEFKGALDETGVKVPMATNLFTDPAFRDEAFTSNDPRGPSYALQKTMRSMDLGEELGAETYVLWGTISGLDFTHGIAQALDEGKLFHIDLDAQKPGRYDQDHRFGSEDANPAFSLVKWLDDARLG